MGIKKCSIVVDSATTAAVVIAVVAAATAVVVVVIVVVLWSDEWVHINSMRRRGARKTGIGSSGRWRAHERRITVSTSLLGVVLWL